MSLRMCLEKTIGLLDLEYWDDNGWRSTAWTCSACNGAVRAVMKANDAEVLCHIWSSSAQLIPFHHWAQKWLMLMRLARDKVFNIHIIDDDNENFLDNLERSNYVTFRALRFSRLVMDTTPSPTPRYWRRSLWSRRREHTNGLSCGKCPRKASWLWASCLTSSKVTSKLTFFAFHLYRGPLCERKKWNTNTSQGPYQNHGHTSIMKATYQLKPQGRILRAKEQLGIWKAKLLNQRCKTEWNQSKYKNIQ